MGYDTQRSQKAAELRCGFRIYVAVSGENCGAGSGRFRQRQPLDQLHQSWRGPMNASVGLGLGWGGLSLLAVMWTYVAGATRRGRRPWGFTGWRI